MSIVEFLSQPLWQRLGLTLVHFLWQGLAVAVLVGVLVRVLRVNHGNARYAAYLLAFIAMMVCPVVTFTVIDIPISPNTKLVTGAEFPQVVDNVSYTVLPAGDILPEAETSSPAIPKLADSIPLGQRISGWLNVSMPWVLVTWMVGVVVLSVRLLMGFVGVYRWRHHLEPLPERLAQRIASLSEGLCMRGFSRVFISPTVLQAMAVGYLRPMILLPAAMVTQMQPEMLEAVIAHELAHIRRLDLWVNLAQRVTETLLFYHPAVWWLSNCLRSERELCCDELAVKATGERITYASTLESVGRARFTAKRPVLAAGLGHDDKPTLGRVRHILGLAPAQRNCPFWLAGVIAVVLLAAIAVPTSLALRNQSDEEVSDLQSVVIEGIRANRAKLECGYLAWSSRQVTTRFADSSQPPTDLAGEYELWWDGKKMATKYVHDQVYKDPEGHYTVEKEQGGDSYDGGVLSRKPSFRDDNWLGPQITRWSGPGSQDWLIEQNSKQEGISKDWSVVETNGVKVIRAITKNMNKTDQDYGGYTIKDYDPSKGYGLVNEEWYNPDGGPRMKHTVKLLEVIPGGWFPVEVDSKSFAMDDGKVYSHHRYGLDMERCRFNDRSVFPARVFKGVIDKQLEYQEKLQKYLAMELEGISETEEAGEGERVKRGAREAVETFIAAAMGGDFESAREFTDPDKAVADQLSDIPEIAKGQNLRIMAVVADDFDAIAVSSVIQGDHERIGPLVFFLDRDPQDGRDNWWVHDIDMETPDGAEGALKQFLEKHPKAQKVPYENKPAVQVEGEEGWGKAVEGVEVRLKPLRENRKWQADEPYLFSMFEVDLRSERERILPNSLGGREFEIEWDGRWYAGREIVDAIRSVGPSMTTHRENVRLLLHSKAWREKGADAPLEYTPGRHTVRAAFLAWPADGDRVESIRALSNAVEIEITAAEQTEFSWGSGDEGVQVRLRPDRLVWQQGDDPAFKVDIRNVGRPEMKTSLIASLALEMDGEVFTPRAWRQVGTVGVASFGPGDQYTIETKLSHFELRDRVPDRLAPGKHTIKAVYLNNRLSGGLYTSLDKYDEMALSHSNRVEIQIAPKG